MPPEYWTLRKEVKTTPEKKDDPVNIDLLADEFIDLAVLTLEEAENLWAEHNGKDLATKGNIAYGAGGQLAFAKKVATELGGMTTASYLKKINGEYYVILKGYKQELKTLLKGNIWKANNINLAQFGLGSAGLKATLKGNIVVTILFSAAVNAVDVLVHDEKAMGDYLGATGVDIVKGVIAAGVGTLIVGGVAVAGVPISLIGGGLLFFGVCTGAGWGLDYFDGKYHWTEYAISSWKKNLGEGTDGKKTAESN
ncbi:hypothetical protein [Halodesulfovibrio aestuarii]|uniref:Uncharacterized protein n=1 Tax=Halodesulfovibrio aestuarii TaxID=126333 RepID=A0ABV4JWC1_9BACT